MTDSMTSAHEWLTDRGPAMEALLRELVEIPSHTADAGGCTRVAERLSAALGALAPSLAVELVPSERFGAHLVAQTSAEGRRVILVGHHDTVFPAAHFAGFREDGPLLRGPGVLDMKGGLVVIAYALATLDRIGLLARVPLALVSVSDEEIGSPEGRRLVLERARPASCALVFESGRANDLIITRRKGTGGITAKAHGRAAHAGNLHHEGANAIWALARFIDRAQQLTDYGRGITVNVGRVAGGLGKNTVPDHAEAQIDFRFVAPADAGPLMAAMEAAAKEAAASVPGTSIELSGGVGRMPLPRTEASAALLAEYAASARAAGLGDGEAPLLGGGSDANTAAEVDCPAIDGLGPRGRGFHTLDEQIERDTLVPKAAALARFLAARAI